MKKRLPLVIAGIIFTLVAVAHLFRVVYQWQVIIAGHAIPMSVSIIALIVTAILALWMFTAAAKN